jgi:hypothetical protein
MRSFFSVPYTFVMLNWAAVMGLLCFLRGDRNLWPSCHTNR